MAKASNILPSVDILSYYEGNARFHFSDRGFIIENGLCEWLLAAINPHEEFSAENSADALKLTRSNTKSNGTNPMESTRCASELAVLVANLIGGGIK